MAKDKNEGSESRGGALKKMDQESTCIELTKEQWDRFLELCEAEHELSTKLKEAAQKLDEEGF